MGNYWRQQVFYFVEAPMFEMFILTCILTNTLIMAMLYFGQPDDYDRFLEFMNLAFAVIFTLEAVLKLVGLGFRQYFHGTRAHGLERAVMLGAWVDAWLLTCVLCYWGCVALHQTTGTCLTLPLSSAHLWASVSSSRVLWTLARWPRWFELSAWGD